MSNLDNAITCHNQSWENYCLICEAEAYRDYIQEMHEDWESGRDLEDDEDYDD